jgi:membrane-associated protease RseP (regulator of RpoE activity)
VDLLVPFVEKHNLKSKYAPPVEGVTGWGVGGPARSMVARAGSMRLGSVKVDAPVMHLSLQKHGAFVSPYVAGNIGAGVLKRFYVTFDYMHQEMVLAPNRSASEPDVFDRAGMWINLDKRGGFEVVDVYRGSAAAQAGLKKGDRIVAVDGRPATDIGLPELRLELRTLPVGTKKSMTVESAGKRTTHTLTLRDLV